MAKLPGCGCTGARSRTKAKPKCMCKGEKLARGAAARTDPTFDPCEAAPHAPVRRRRRVEPDFSIETSPMDFPRPRPSHDTGVYKTRVSRVLSRRTWISTGEARLFLWLTERQMQRTRSLDARDGLLWLLVAYAPLVALALFYRAGAKES